METVRCEHTRVHPLRFQHLATLEVVVLLLIPRAHRPDAVHWPGRRLLSVLDAIVWPLTLVAAARSAPFDTGLAGSVVVALAVVSAFRRLFCAVYRNERYWFTTWRWGRTLAQLAFVGIAMKLLA